MRRSTTAVSALLLAGAIAFPAMSNAQADPSANPSVVTDTDRRDGNDRWGWLGLLGLVGLMGLKRNRETERDHVVTRQPV